MEALRTSLPDPAAALIFHLRRPPAGATKPLINDTSPTSLHSCRERNKAVPSNVPDHHSRSAVLEDVGTGSVSGRVVQDLRAAAHLRKAPRRNAAIPLG